MTFHIPGKGLAALAATLVLGLAAVKPTLATTYSVTDLGTLGGATSYAFSVNEANQVAGYSSVNGTTHAFLYSNSKTVDLGTISGASSSYGYALNYNGNVTGISGGHGFLYNNGAMIDLGALPGGSSAAYGINTNGDIVGQAKLGTLGLNNAFFMKAGTTTMQDLGTLGGLYSTATAINDNDQIVGSAYLYGNSSCHAFIWSGGQMRDVGTLGGWASYGNAINSNGRIVGWSYMSDNLTKHAFFWGPVHGMRDLGVLNNGAPILYSYANGMNSHGVVVGESSGRGVIWRNLVIADLNSFLPAGSGWTITAAYSVNEIGAIAADGVYNGQHHAVLLVPGG